jgi:hypothetical protein
MANTKKMSRAERKRAKRKSRLELRKLRDSLTREQRSELSKSNKGIKAFLAEAKKTAE